MCFHLSPGDINCSRARIDSGKSIVYQVQQLEKRYKQLERERNELQVKQSALSSPEYIARVATKKLGMVPPEPGQLVLVTLDSDPTDGPLVAGVKVRMAKNELSASTHRRKG